MFSQTVEYALRAMFHMGRNPDEAHTTRAVAEAMQIPPSYLAKVMQNLVRANLVRSQRGVRGGFTLTRPPERISLLEVVNAVDPIPRIRTCPLQIKCHENNLCKLHAHLDAAYAQIERAFEGTTLADLYTEEASSFS